MPEITLTNESKEDVFEIRNTREPFAAHAKLKPGESKTMTINDSNELTIAREGVMAEVGKSPIEGPAIPVGDQAKESPKKKEPKAE